MHTTNSILSERLIDWYLNQRRDLPWRNTKQPYFIWLSEVIMQQTRVKQGLPYYLKFIENYPNVHRLANASQDEILKLWQGLGYYSRARNLHKTAKFISKERKGVFPNNYSELIQLKGVGDYTASAIASICFNVPEAVVDGNVFRVLSRIFGISTPINTNTGKKEFKSLAQKLISKKNPGDFNQAIMEFGSQQCVPRNPNCVNCIFRNECFAYRNERIHEFPVKHKTKPVQKRFFNYIIPISSENKTLLYQRKRKDIWKKLFEFPLIETNEGVNKNQLIKEEKFLKFSKLWKINNLVLFNRHPIIHKLSHQHIYTDFWIVEISNATPDFISFDEIENFAVPALIANFISEFKKDQIKIIEIK